MTKSYPFSLFDCLYYTAVLRNCSNSIYQKIKGIERKNVLKHFSGPFFNLSQHMAPTYLAERPGNTPLISCLIILSVSLL